jgi:hypothetical protein
MNGMQQANGTARQAVISAARTVGVDLSPAQASAIAAAALTHADDEHHLVRLTYRERWSDDGYRAYMRAEMQRALHKGLVEQEMLPVTLPAEKLVYCDDRMAEMPESAPWSAVQVFLRVPVRRARGN